MTRKDKFYIDNIDNNNITIKESNKEHSAFIWFFINNGRLIFTISVLFVIAVLTISISLFLKNIKESTIVTYESNGVSVEFDGTDNSIINGTPIEKEYANNLFDNNINDKQDINNLLNMKNITLNNTNNKDMKYIVVLEETNNYSKYNTNKRLLNDYINYNVYVNNNKYYNNILNNNLKYNDNYSFDNNTYLLYEGTIDKLSSVKINIGFWISYEDITNEYMDSSFIGTTKVYVEE